MLLSTPPPYADHTSRPFILLIWSSQSYLRTIYAELFLTGDSAPSWNAPHKTCDLSVQHNGPAEWVGAWRGGWAQSCVSRGTILSVSSKIDIIWATQLLRTSLQHLVLTKAKHWITKQSSKDAVKRLVQKRFEVLSSKSDTETCNINRYILCFVAVPAGEEQWNGIFHQETAASLQALSNLLLCNYPAIWPFSFRHRRKIN